MTDPYRSPQASPPRYLELVNHASMDAEREEALEAFSKTFRRAILNKLSLNEAGGEISLIHRTKLIGDGLKSLQVENYFKFHKTDRYSLSIIFLIKATGTTSCCIEWAKHQDNHLSVNEAVELLIAETLSHPTTSY